MQVTLSRGELCAFIKGGVWTWTNGDYPSFEHHSDVNESTSLTESSQILLLDWTPCGVPRFTRKDTSAVMLILTFSFLFFIFIKKQHIVQILKSLQCIYCSLREKCKILFQDFKVCCFLFEKLDFILKTFPNLSNVDVDFLISCLGCFYKSILNPCFMFICCVLSLLKTHTPYNARFANILKSSL